ncbi:hypothetical protein VULLAG_LOCUS2555 [Vulpes lagopus]
MKVMRPGGSPGPFGPHSSEPRNPLHRSLRGHPSPAPAPPLPGPAPPTREYFLSGNGSRGSELGGAGSPRLEGPREQPWGRAAEAPGLEVRQR